MTKEDFKQKYLVDAFFWINKDNYLLVQGVLQSFGYKSPTGDGFISWHEGFKNLATFKASKFKNFDYYQKCDMFIPGSRYGEPKNVNEMMLDFDLLQKNTNNNG